MVLPRLRLAVDASAWQPSSGEFDYVLSLLPDDEQKSCIAFRREEDKKHAAISRLLQRYAASTCLGIPFRDVCIRRTRGRKPFVSNPRPQSAPVNWNYNVSHEGRYVILCSEVDCIVGCDVAAPRALRPGKVPASAIEYVRSFKSQLSDAEWSDLTSLASDDLAVELHFQKLWCLKEAFGKACGLGLAAPLGKATFTMSTTSDAATLSFDGQVRSDWAFALHNLPFNHWVGVARAPPADVVDQHGEFLATLSCLRYEEAAWEAILRRPEPPMSMLPLSLLLPADALEGFEVAGGDIL